MAIEMYAYLLFAQHLANKYFKGKPGHSMKHPLVRVHFLTMENVILLFVTCL